MAAQPNTGIEQSLRSRKNPGLRYVGIVPVRPGARAALAPCEGAEKIIPDAFRSL